MGVRASLSSPHTYRSQRQTQESSFAHLSFTPRFNDPAAAWVSAKPCFVFHGSSHTARWRLAAARHAGAMKVVVFGASGSTGRLVVESALSAGHFVTAFVRDSKRM